MAFQLKVGYTTNPSDENIQSAIAAGKLDSGDLIIGDVDNAGCFKFIRQDGTILSFPGASQEAIRTIVEEINSVDVIDTI